MIIGIDIDDTLNREFEFMIDFGTKFCHENKKYKLEKIDGHESTEVFGWSDKVAHEFWHKAMIPFSKMPAVPYSGEVITKLKKEGHSIYIITAREHGDEWYPKEIADNMETFTAKWLLDNGIPFDKIFFNAKDKAKVCKDNHVDIMIDDDPLNIDDLVGVTNVFIYDKPYNRKPEYNVVTRVYSWYDAYEKIKEFEAKKSGRKVK